MRAYVLNKCFDDGFWEEDSSIGTGLKWGQVKEGFSLKYFTLVKRGILGALVLQRVRWSSKDQGFPKGGQVFRTDTLGTGLKYF